MLGTTISNVRIIEHLGRSRTADLYLGHHTTLGQEVVVKVLTALDGSDAAVRARFLKQAGAVAALVHPNIHRLYDFGVLDVEDESHPYLIMERLQGTALDEYLETLHTAGERITAQTAAHLVIGLASALDYAHGRGMVHGVISPQEVIFRRGDLLFEPLAPTALHKEPLLTGFDNACSLEAAPQPGAWEALWRYAYRPPEGTHTNKDRLGLIGDSRGDVYSLGVVLYVMLAGHLPQAPGGESPSGGALPFVVPPPPVPGLDVKVQAVLDRALAADPKARYQKAGDLAFALLAAVYGLGNAQQAGGQEFVQEPPQLVGLLNTLELLEAQARSYEHALPPDNYPARAAVIGLAKLGRLALNEARDLAAAQTIQPDLTTPDLAIPHPLSPRELEVLNLAATGLTNKEIAYRLGISDRTVQFHMNSVFNKTGTQSRTEAVALALNNGWLPNAD